MNATYQWCINHLRQNIIFKVTDILAILFAYHLTLWYRFVKHTANVFNPSGDYLYAYGEHKWYYLIPIATVLFVIYSFAKIYNSQRFLRFPVFVTEIIISNLILFGLLSVGLYLRRNTWHPRSFFALFCLINVGVTCLFRFAWLWVLRYLVRKPHSVWQMKALLLGETPEADAIGAIIERRGTRAIKVVEKIPLPQAFTPEWFADFEGKLAAQGIDLAIVADKTLPIDVVMKLLEITDQRNVMAKILSESLSILHMKIGEPSDIILGIPLVHFDVSGHSGKGTWARLVASRAMAAAALCALSPVFLLVGAMIKMKDKGPVFFRQTRYGQNLKPFEMYKFRTMKVNAEEMLDSLEAKNEAKGGGLFKIKDDPRITPFGHFLRKYSLDELPQIINVLKGEMRVVGPRPLPKRDIDNYKQEWHYYRHNHGKPGLTCLWQIYDRSEVDFENMCILDMYYLRNQNWIMDIQIVLRTLHVMLTGHGAY